MALHLAVVGGIAGDEHNVAPVILGDLAEGGLQHLGALREQLLTFGVAASYALPEVPVFLE